MVADKLIHSKFDLGDTVVLKDSPNYEFKVDSIIIDKTKGVCCDSDGICHDFNELKLKEENEIQ